MQFFRLIMSEFNDAEPNATQKIDGREYRAVAIVFKSCLPVFESCSLLVELLVHASVNHIR